MANGWKKTLSVLIVFLSSLGILLSVFFLIQVWRFQQPVTDQLQIKVDQFSAILHNTNEALTIIDQLVENVYTSTNYLEDSTTALSLTLATTIQFIDSADTFIGDNLIATITNTQAALDSAQASAKVIDNILEALSRVPLIGINYSPNLPLNVALSDVSSSLDPLPEILTNFQKSIKTTHSNLQVFTGQIDALEQNITSISFNMEKAHLTISDYHTQLSSLISFTDNAKANLHNWMKFIAWVITAIILWLLITQLSILIQSVSNLIPAKTEQDDTIDKPQVQQDQG
jgi:hypothetical protein